MHIHIIQYNNVILYKFCVRRKPATVARPRRALCNNNKKKKNKKMTNNNKKKKNNSCCCYDYHV